MILHSHQALGDAAFDFKFEGSALLDTLMQGQTHETHPEMFTKHCWDVENRLNKPVMVNPISAKCSTAILVGFNPIHPAKFS